MDYKKRSRNMVILESIAFTFVWTVILICHRLFRKEYFKFWILHIGINTTARRLGLFLLLSYAVLAALWLLLTTLLYMGLKQRNSIKLLVWSLLHFVILAPFSISAIFVIAYNYKLFPIFILVIYRGISLWIVNGLNNEIVRQRQQGIRICRA